MSCECCWDDRRGWPREDYHAAMARHEKAKCVCTKDTLEGRRAQAGQFWDENELRDTREPAVRGDLTIEQLEDGLRIMDKMKEDDDAHRD